MVTIQDIIPLSNISRKQIGNRIKPIKKKYPNLIKGGGRGKGGKYQINPLLIKHLTIPNTEVKVSGEDKKRMNDKQDEFLKNLPPFDTMDTFKEIEWDWFCCYHPVKEITDIQELIDCIPMNEGDLCYYSIHRKNESGRITKHHIHFVLKSDLTKNDISKTTPFYSDYDIQEFDLTDVEGCYNYFSNSNLLRSDKQELCEWGYLMNIKDEKVHLWGRK